MPSTLAQRGMPSGLTYPSSACTRWSIGSRADRGWGYRATISRSCSRVLVVSAMSAIHPAHHRVDGRHCRDDVGDLAALTQCCGGLQIGERRVPEVHPIGSRATVADDMHAELAARRLDGNVGLARWHGEALRDELEVMDESLHRLAHDVADVVEAVAEPVAAERQLRRPRDLAVLDHHGARPQLVEALLDDLERLAQLGQADQEPAVRVAGVSGGDVELIALVPAVRLRL